MNLTPSKRRGPSRVPAALAAMLVALLLGAWPASAQDYGRLVETLGAAGGGAVEAAPEAPPAPAASEGGEPDLEAYGQVAREYEEQRSTLQMTQKQVDVFRQKARRVFGAAPHYFEDVRGALREASPTGRASYFFGVFLFTIFLLAVGRAATMIYAMYVALPVMRRISRPNPDGIVEKLPVLAARVGISIGGVAIMLLVAAAVGAGFYTDDEATLTTVIAIASALAISQLIDVLWRMVLSPFLPEYRIPSFSDGEARKLYRWLAVGAFLGVSSSIFAAWLEEVGVPEEPIALSYIGLTFVSVVLIVLMVRSCGRAVTTAILGGLPRSEASWIAALTSVLWRPFVIVYMIGAWLEMAYRMIMGLEIGFSLLGGAFMVLLAGLVVYAVTIYVVAQLFRRARAMRQANEAAAAAERAEEEEEANKVAIRDALEAVGGADADGGDDEGGAGPVALKVPPPTRRRGMKTFEDLAHRVASLFALGAGAYAMIRVWAGDDAFVEGGVWDVAQDLIDVCFIGYVTFHAARIWMDQKIEQEGGTEVQLEPGDEGGAAGAASRLAT
ncbi:MAG: hypothetical protein AAGF90_05390, partial [Pseudomonadota bacterium]